MDDDPTLQEGDDAGGYANAELRATADDEASADEQTGSCDVEWDDIPLDRPSDGEFEYLRDRSPLPGDAEFALCLTHDVDRPYKGIRSLYYAIAERSARHVRTAISSENPYWQFAEIMELEDDLDVRSAFYFLNEQHLLLERPVGDWLAPGNWVQHLGRYRIDDPEIVDVVRELEDGGWEVGIHGSYHSFDDRDRLREEKESLEAILDGPLSGGRQHHLRVEVPDTWEHHRSIGLEYDASLGSSTECGFQAGYRPLRPFGDEFLVFPLTVMDQALPDPGDRFEEARETCEQLLLEAAANDAVMTVLWHPRFFNEREFPGYRTLYRWLIERARELGGWIGSPGELCETFDGGSAERFDVAKVERETSVDGVSTVRNT